MLIQFGHNDARSDDLARFASPEAYAENLRRSVRELRELRERNAQPLLATPVVRRRFDERGQVPDSHGPYPDALRRVAREENVPLLELHERTREWLQALGPEASLPAFQHLPPATWRRYPQGRHDDTHLSLGGARAVAALVAAELRRLKLPLAIWLRPEAQMPFPQGGFEATGWAHATRGGAGGRIVRVNTLAADGPGSLAEAVAMSGPRIVVFEVGGTIDLAGAALAIKEPFLTIAGQTAPSPGITITRAEVQLATHDVIVQHLRLRPGEWGRPKKGGGDQDGLSTLAGAHHVIVDHCSFSWATDENLSASGPRFAGGPGAEHWRRATPHAITYSHNLVYEGLSQSVHEKGEHSKGSLIHDNTSGILLLANVLRQGPDTPPQLALFTMLGDGDLALHLEGNLATDQRGQPVAELVNASRGARVLPTRLPLPGDVSVRSTSAVLQDLPRAVGARPWDRDALDARVLFDMARGVGKIIDSELQSPLGGFLAQQPVTRRAFVEAEWDFDRMRPRAGWAAMVAAR